MAKRLKRALVVLVLLVVVAAVGVWLFLRASQARIEGEMRSAGLAAEVLIERDALGIASLKGQNRLDIAYATGFVHAQDRYFQMDLLRRVAAGEMAALIGSAALDLDRQHRLHRFRARAHAALAAMPANERALLDRYVAGVNAGLADLGARPFEYGLLMTQPQAWQPEDSLLVVWAMYFDLQGHQQGREFVRGWLAAHSSAEQLQFLLPGSSQWDAPLDAAGIDEPVAPIPAKAPDWLGMKLPDTVAADDMRTAVGSNSWALAGTRSQSGAALIANDMHLGLRLPHTWYRVDLQFADASGPRRVTGVSLPGAPLVVVGSNGRLAWGFTNSYGDYLDLIEVQADPKVPGRYQLPGGWEQAKLYAEQLAVRGGKAETLAVHETSLGPIWQVDGKHYAVHWVAHQPGAVNYHMQAMDGLSNVAD
ncbi:penicillin acylase family protein, partial [Chitinimonas sp.]|uniref:penicillin acylase family protein n=1 Tax=Chitinimonas sp. TaxID=1934313 RepID=UPI0035B0FF32